MGYPINRRLAGYFRGTLVLARRRHVHVPNPTSRQIVTPPGRACKFQKATTTPTARLVCFLGKRSTAVGPGAVLLALFLRYGRDRLWLLPCEKSRLSRSNRNLAVRIAVGAHAKSSNTEVQPRRCRRRVGWRLRDFHQSIARAAVDALRERWPTESTLTPKA